MNTLQSITSRLPERSAIVNVTKEYSKYAVVGIAVITASTLAFYSPFLYVGITALSSLPIAYYTAHTILNDKSAEKMKLITAIAIGVIGIGITGGCMGIAANGAVIAYTSAVALKTFLPFVPYLTIAWYETLIGVEFAAAILGTSMATGALGMIPYGKRFIDRAIELYNEPMKPGLQAWANLPINSRISLNIIDKILLFISLATNQRPPRDLINLNMVISRLNGETLNLQGSLEYLDICFSYGNNRQKIGNFLEVWPTIINDIQFVANEKKSEIIMDIVDRIIRWEIPFNNRHELGRHACEFFNKHLILITAAIIVDAQEYRDAQIQYQTLRAKIESINPEIPVDSDQLNSLKDEINDLRKKLSIYGKKLASAKQICTWLRRDSSEIESALKEINGYLTQLNSQTKNNSTLFDKLQLICSKAAANQNNIDKEDTLWNFLAVNGTSLQTLKAMAKTEDVNDIDGFFVRMGIGTVGDLLKQGFITEKELLDISNRRHEIEDKLIAYINAKANPDFRSLVYRSLTAFTGNASYSANVAKIDQIAANIFYKLTMTFAIMAPIITGPSCFIPCLALGLAYPVLNKLSRGYLTKAIKKVMKSRDPRIQFYSLFARRNLLSLNESSRQDLQTFIQADTFGRLRLFAVETGIAGITSIVFGPVIQPIMIGKEFSESIGSAFNNHST